MIAVLARRYGRFLKENARTLDNIGMIAFIACMFVTVCFALWPTPRLPIKYGGAGDAPQADIANPDIEHQVYVDSQKITDLERRMASAESVESERRLTRLEAYTDQERASQEEIRHIMLGVLASIILIFIERVSDRVMRTYRISEARHRKDVGE